MRAKISKIGKLIDREQFLLRYTKRFGELWSTNYIDLDARLDPLKCTSLGNYISALMGAVPEIFTRTRD